MTEPDWDRLLDLFGVVLVLAIVGSLVLLGLGATSVQQETAAGPDADWTLERVNESHVRVWHDGGEPVPTEYLSVAVDGRHRRVYWTATVLTEGEYGVVRAGRSTRVALLWQRTEGDRTVLDRWAP
jgi:hypothetical protein